jgi:hypothetical protein
MASSLPQPPPPGGSERKSSSINPLILGCVVVPLIVVVLALFAAMMGWRKFVSYGIASDFTEYQAKVRSMQDLDPAVKKPLLERLERLRDKARSSPISFWRWVDYDESIKSMIDDERLPPDEVEALNRELDRMEAEFR